MFYTRSSYVGQTTKDGKRMHGRGIYTLADGSKYIGTFHDGTFHGHGIVFFTPANGGGQFRGTWNLGECLGGDYIFKDGLEFSNEEWEYTTERDGRFWDEYLTFIKPVGAGGKDSADEAGVITPDYCTTDGIPPAFADGKPQSAEDVSDDFWATAPLPRPEHEGVAPIVGTSEDMAAWIAETRVGGPYTKPRNTRGPRKVPARTEAAPSGAELEAKATVGVSSLASTAAGANSTGVSAIHTPLPGVISPRDGPTPTTAMGIATANEIIQSATKLASSARLDEIQNDGEKQEEELEEVENEAEQYQQHLNADMDAQQQLEYERESADEGERQYDDREHYLEDGADQQEYGNEEGNHSFDNQEPYSGEGEEGADYADENVDYQREGETAEDGQVEEHEEELQ